MNLNVKFIKHLLLGAQSQAFRVTQIDEPDTRTLGKISPVDIAMAYREAINNLNSGFSSTTDKFES